MCCICSQNIKCKRIAHLILVFGSVEMIVVLSVVVVGPLVAVSSIGGSTTVSVISVTVGGVGVSVTVTVSVSVSLNSCSWSSLIVASTDSST